MAHLDAHPLVKAAYDVCQLIEACGASEALTKAVSAASALLDPIEALAAERDRLKAENAQLRADLAASEAKWEKLRRWCNELSLWPHDGEAYRRAYRDVVRYMRSLDAGAGKGEQ